MSQGRRFKLHPPALDFARYHGVELVVCQARDAKRKGKCERPFRDLKESFLTELDALGAPESVAELNQRAGAWLDRRVHARPHSTTRVAPGERLDLERRLLGPLPRRRFDTAYVADRRVHPKWPLVEWDSVPYSVPPEVVGSKVACRVEVDSDTLEVSWAGAVRRPAPAPPGVRRPGVGPRPSGRRRGHRPGPVPAGRYASSPHPAADESVGTRRIGVRRGGLRHRRARPGRPLRGLWLHRGGGMTVTEATSAYEQLKNDLGYLQLGRAAECFATVAEQAKAGGWSHVEYLARVVAEQASATTNRRLAARLRYARFPYRRSVEDFDFDFQPTVDRKLVDDLATLRFIAEGRSIAFLGQPGCGKTHLAVALATLAVEAGYRGYFTTADDMVAVLARARVEGTWASKLRTYTAPTVLVIDDVGLLPMARDAAAAFFHVVSHRYDKHAPTLITTNRGLPKAHRFGRRCARWRLTHTGS